MASDVRLAMENNTKGEYPRVAAVLDRYQVVINRGRKHGVKLGQTFLVFSSGPEIIDPVTGDNLGSLELVKGRGKVIHLQDNLATLRSASTKGVYSSNPNPFSLGSPQLIRYDEQPFETVDVG